MDDAQFNESLWRRGWRDTKSVWSSWYFYVLDGIVGVIVGGLTMWYWGLLIVAFGMICAWLGATGRASIRQRNEARRQTGILQAEVSEAQKQRDEAKRNASATPTELIGRHLHGLSIRVADLVREDVHIRGRTFEDCHLYGPALMGFLHDNTMTGCTFEGAPNQSIDDLFVEIIPPRTIIGAIGFEDCVFRRCVFHRIGIVAPAELIQKIKSYGISQI